MWCELSSASEFCWKIKYKFILQESSQWVARLFKKFSFHSHSRAKTAFFPPSFKSSQCLSLIARMIHTYFGCHERKTVLSWARKLLHFLTSEIFWFLRTSTERVRVESSVNINYLLLNTTNLMTDLPVRRLGVTLFLDFFFPFGNEILRRHCIVIYFFINNKSF